MTTPRADEAMEAANRLGQRTMRRSALRLTAILAAGLLLSLVALSHLRMSPRLPLSPVDLAVLFRMIGLTLLVLIPTAGIYSLLTQFTLWEGWIEGLPNPNTLFEAAETTSKKDIQSFVVYLDGIHQTENDHPPRIRAFLTRLADRLGPRTCLLHAIEPYTVLPVGLAEDEGSAWFWRRLLSFQENHPNRMLRLLATVLVQANNVIKVGISSDRRYGPILNLELALKVARLLMAAGYQPASGSSVTLLGYSGGGEMAMGMAADLRRLCHCPVHIITFCGVFSGNQDLSTVASITTVVGERDPMEAIGRLAYPGRTRLLPFSRWNRIRESSRVRRVPIAGMGHNGHAGPFSDRHREKVITAIQETLQQPAPS